MNEPTKPAIGPTGSPVVQCTINVSCATQRLEVLFGPRKPERDIWTWGDDDEPVFVRERTDEELAEALDLWAKADATWRKNSGIFFVPGETTVTAECVCEDGTDCSGFWSGDQWHWVNYETRAGHTNAES